MKVHGSQCGSVRIARVFKSSSSVEPRKVHQRKPARKWRYKWFLLVLTERWEPCLWEGSHASHNTLQILHKSCQWRYTDGLLVDAWYYQKLHTLGRSTNRTTNSVWDDSHLKLNRVHAQTNLHDHFRSWKQSLFRDNSCFNWDWERMVWKTSQLTDLQKISPSFPRFTGLIA